LSYFTEPYDTLPSSKILPLIRILSQTSLVHDLPTYFFKIYFNIILWILII